MQFKFKPLILAVVLLAVQITYAVGTLKILLVDDDNYSSPDHLPTIEQAIEDAGYSYDMFNAQDSAASPTADVMAEYDLIFWYLANDGVGAYFWNGKDTVNTELQTYLDNGGMVWAMGNDIIYDAYGGAPDTFYTGDFLYDYFGLSIYNVQSKGDDGGVGVPMLIRVPGQDVATSLDTMRWKYSGLYWVDGCTPRSEAQSVYLMGDDDYVLSGYASAVFFDNGTSKTFGTYFDAYYIDNSDNRTAFFKDVLDYFSTQLSTSNPPSAFSLKAPADESWQAIGVAQDSVHFTWQESSDPEGTTITYKFYLSTTSDITESSILEQETTSNTAVISNATLQGFVAENDTLELYWTVRARDDDYATTWAADTFKITLVNIVNQPPADFHLLSPDDGTNYIVENMEDSVNFTWESSADPEGGALTHTFVYWGEGFKNEKQVATNTAALSNATLLDMLNSKDTLVINWTAKVSDVFEATTCAQDTFTLIVLNRYNAFTSGPELTFPQQNRHFFFKNDMPALVHFQWNAAKAYRQPTYHLAIYDDQSQLLFETDTTGTDVEVDLQSALSTATGDTVAFTWDVTAKIETTEAASENGPFTTYFVKQNAAVLVVFDDNYSTHNDDIRASLAKLNLEYTDFDCGKDDDGNITQIPTFDDMKDFQVVFWFTGNDGKGLAFWNGNDSTNSAIIEYLDHGGRFWVVGIDFLYDRYGSAPDTFQTGDFVYDYLGISSYDAQSKKDDDGSGVPLVYLDKESAPTGISGQDTLTWKYSTLWYVDAITPVEGAKVVYRMGPADYALAGMPTFISYDLTNSITLTTTFNARQFDESDDKVMLDRFLFDVLNWMQHQTLTDVAENQPQIPQSFTINQNFPNPFNPSTSVPISLPKAGKVKLAVFNVLGQKVLSREYRLNAGMHVLKIHIPQMASGVYYYQVTFDHKTMTRKMMLLK